MPIQVVCSCSKRYKAIDELAGQKVACPACGALIAVPDDLIVPTLLSKEEQQADNLNRLARVRFLGDAMGARALMQHPDIVRRIQQCGDQTSPQSARLSLLANAVRVDEEILPDIGRAFREIHERTGLIQSLECYVFESPSIDACVFPARDRYIVLLSSAAIEKLDLRELEFVIGHEIGHVAYGHFHIPVKAILSLEDDIDPRHVIELLSWHRHAEISADRAGLLCCGSLEVAANAFFKVLSGLSLKNVKAQPLRLADQFDHLREEMSYGTSEDMWMMTHPFSPLRMKAMAIFWESEHARYVIPGAPGSQTRESSDSEIHQMLAYMDPFASRGTQQIDPRLELLLTWGGLIVAASDGAIDPTELRALASLVGQQRVEQALREPRRVALYLERFQAVLQRREYPLTALDINRLLTCLIAVVRADGSIAQSEIVALRQITKLLGVTPSYVDQLLNSM